MANDANIKAVITAQDDASGVLAKFGDTLKGTSDEADRTESSLGRLTKAFIFGNVLYSVGANVAVRFKEGLTSIIEQANEAAKVQQQLNAVIASTGGVAGVTAKAANELADSIRNNTSIDNDAVLGAENMLLTFRAIGKNEFPTATKAVVDMATAMNGGLTPNAEQLRQKAIQVGKALQDPILGVTTLRKEGVNLSAQQQQQIKDFIAVNDKASAQKVILNELSGEFGGSAAATAETFSGKLQQMRNKMDDFGKSVVLNIENTLNKNLPNIENFAASIARVYDKVANFLQPSLDALWNNFVKNLMPALLNFWHNVIEPLTPAIGAILVAAVWLFVNSLNAVVSIISPVIRVVTQLISWLGNLGGAFINLARGIPNFLSGVKDAIEAPFKAAFDDIKAGIKDVENTFNRVKNDVTSAPGKAASGIKGVLSHLPGFAAGTDFAPGGAAIVGEQGPEIVNLPRGSQVIPSNKVGGGSTVNININAGAFLGTDVEARKYAQFILGHLKDIANSKNMSLSQMIGA